MARRWVVRDSDNVILEYTESTTQVAGAGQTIYTDPANDARWVRGGTYDGTTYTAPAGQPVPDDPTTAVGRKRIAVRAAWEQLDRWEAALLSAGRGQPSTIRDLGHDLILGQRKALYLRAVTSTIPAAGIESYAGQISRGASDITNVPTFYRLATPLRKGVWRDGDPVEWATLTNNVATRRTLQASITAAPADFVAGVRDFSTIDLGTDDWIRTAIT